MKSFSQIKITIKMNHFLSKIKIVIKCIFTKKINSSTFFKYLVPFYWKLFFFVSYKKWAYYKSRQFVFIQSISNILVTLMKASHYPWLWSRLHIEELNPTTSKRLECQKIEEICIYIPRFLLVWLQCVSVEN